MKYHWSHLLGFRSYQPTPEEWQELEQERISKLLEKAGRNCGHEQAEYTPGEDWRCPECHWQGHFFPAELTD